MGQFIIRRIVQAIPVIIMLSIIAFAMFHLAPGGPGALYSRDLTIPQTPEELARIRHLYGLDRPLPIQYMSWVGGIVEGDLGKSYRNGEPVIELLSRTLGPTLLLVTTSMVLSLVIAVPIGVLSAVKRYGLFDYLATSIAFFGISIPTFWIGLMAILVFAVWFRILPTTGMQDLTTTPSVVDTLRHLILPATVLALPLIGSWTRFVRSSMLEVMSDDYVRTARAKGLAERTVIFRHALRNSLIPLVTLIGLTIGYILSSSAIVEYVFAWPGLGQKYIFAAVQDRDYPVLMGALLLVSVFALLGSLVADIGYALVDPRIRVKD
ncbi:MAG TPA: ABC transporter permease [Anaerolineae bacterium]|nr:ABC transporter permease [Anaerolineae bacterium]